MLALIAALGTVAVAHVPIGDFFTFLLDIIWKIFDLLIGAIQAFIFALLTILYFDAATSVSHGDDHGKSHGSADGHEVLTTKTQ